MEQNFFLKIGFIQECFFDTFKKQVRTSQLVKPSLIYLSEQLVKPKRLKNPLSFCAFYTYCCCLDHFQVVCQNRSGLVANAQHWLCWMVGKQYDESRDNLFKKFHSRREEKKINHQRGDESVLTLLQLLSVMPFFPQI